VASEDGLRSAYTALTRDIADNTERTTSAITIQKMLWSVEYQLILAVEKDAHFGAVMRFGTGGMGYDLFHDYSIALPPLNQALARRLIQETRAFEMLQGYRGRPPIDIRQLERMLVSVSNLIVDFPEIVSIEMDPMAVVEDKVLVLGVAMAITSEPTTGRTPYPHLVITPYPARYTTLWRLKDGTEIILRSIKPEDEPLEHEMLTSLREETLKERFFSPMNEWTHDTLVRFCNIDYEREVAIVAEPVGQKRIIGIGRLVIQPDFESSEFAVLVHDEFQGQGLGHKLINLLIGIAREKGLQEIVGTVLSDNERMLRLCRRLGFTTRLAPSGVSKAILRLE
jgi:acetyltransferase